MRKIFTLTGLFLFIVISPGFGQEVHTPLYKFQQRDAEGFRVFGLINADGKIIAEPIFNDIGIFSEGLAYVTLKKDKDIKVGYIDTSGKIVIEAKYQPFNHRSRIFSEGLVAVRIDDRFGYINTKGDFIIAPKYVKVYPFNEGYAVVETSYSEKIIIDQNANVVIDPVSVYRTHVKDVKKGETVSLDERVKNGTITMYIHQYNQPTKCTLIDLDGNFLFPPKPTLLYEMSDGLLRAQTSDRKRTGYINKNGKTVIPFDYASGTDFKNGYAKVQDKSTKLFGIIDLNGNYAVLPEYTYISDDYYKSDYIFARKPLGNFGYIDYKGNNVIDFKYSYGGFFSEGLAVVSTPLNENMYIDKEGNKAFDLDFNISQYDNENFKGGIAKVNLKDGYSAYVNKEGTIIFKFK